MHRLSERPDRDMGRQSAIAWVLLLLGLPLHSGEPPVRNWALLVGVAEYPSLPPERQLLGPPNDIRAMEQVLRRLSPDWAGIQILADGVPNSRGLPTRERIISSFAELRRHVRTGDFVLIYFSGHGSQQPASPGDTSEEDGLDEIFLPRDIGRWSGQTGRVRNALTDDHLNGLIAPLLAAGARVWAVFDTCHSGTITRGPTRITGSSDDERARFVPPDELGVPSSARSSASMSLQEHSTWADGLIVFSAARSDETTPELRLPRGDPDGQQRGLFTFTLIQALEHSDAGTFGQLAEFIATQYALARRVAPSPVFEGALAQELGSWHLPFTPLPSSHAP